MSKIAAAKKPAKKSKPAAKPALKRVKPPQAPAKAARKKAVKAVVLNSAIFLPRDEYKAHIDGLMAEGLDREDAIHTLKVGIREANGRPVPRELQALDAANSPHERLAA